MVVINPSLAPSASKKISLKEKFKVLPGVLPLLILGLLVIIFIYTGITTPTESGAFGAIFALIIILAMKQLSIKGLFNILNNTAKTTGMFFLIVIGGMFFSFILMRLVIPQGMASFILGMDLSGWVIILLINVLLFVLGMFLDPMSVLVIVVPMFFPTVIALGYDPVWFGIMVTINAELGAITPPVGLNLFVLKSVVPNVKMSDVIMGSIIFILPLTVGLILVVLFPEIALFLPNFAK